MRALGPLVMRRELVLAALAATAHTPAAFAKYGEFARIQGEEAASSVAAGDAANECLFATPGSGICQVYRSSAPKIWASPDTEVALKKLLVAAQSLNALDEYIASSKWTAIVQALGASSDLREACGFLTDQAGPESAAKAKVVFRALDGVALAAQKKSVDAAKQYFAKYTAAMPELIKAVS